MKTGENMTGEGFIIGCLFGITSGLGVYCGSNWVAVILGIVAIGIFLAGVGGRIAKILEKKG